MKKDGRLPMKILMVLFCGILFNTTLLSGCDYNHAKNASAAKVSEAQSQNDENARQSETDADDSSTVAPLWTVADDANVTGGTTSNLDDDNNGLSDQEIIEYLNSGTESSIDQDLPAELPEEYRSQHCEVRNTAYYPCNFSTDKNYVQEHGIDITVGDNLYMTQINDWYMNIDKYEGKTVQIEGFYLDFSPYVFIGRNGPTCPYCTGGFVDFEIMSDQDLSQLQHADSWISVQGIIKKGYDLSMGEFYFIEAVSVQQMDTAGKTYISN